MPTYRYELMTRKADGWSQGRSMTMTDDLAENIKMIKLRGSSALRQKVMYRLFETYYESDEERIVFKGSEEGGWSDETDNPTVPFIPMRRGRMMNR